MGELELGSDAVGDAHGLTYEAGEALSAGDVVAVTGGQAVAANSGVTAEDNPVGVVAEGSSASAAGDDVTVYFNGSGVVCNVAAGVGAGTELAASATDGQLAAGSGGFEALSDEGAASGLGIGASLPANGAVVKLP